MHEYPLFLRILRTLVIAPLPLAFIAGCGGGGESPSPPPTVDTTPDAFSFAAVTGAARGVFVESAAATITGINAAANVSITGGEYSIAGGAFTSGASSVTNGQTIIVRVTTAVDFDTQSSAMLTVGGVSGNFSVTTLAAPQVLVDVNVNVRHSVGGVDSFDRPKFITVHSSPSDHDWFGNNAQSRNEPNALPDLMQDFLGGKDVYLGRNTGGITWYLGEMAEDGTRPGFVDETDATNTGNSVRSNYSNNMDARWVSTRLHDERAVNMIVGAQQHPFWPDGTPTRQGWALSQSDTPAEPLGTATGHWMGQYMSKFFRPAGSSADGQDKPPLVEVMNEPVWELHDAADPPEALDRIFEFHNTVAHEIRATNDDVLIGGYTTAFPNFEEDDFDRWRDRNKLFLDLAGANMDFVSIHLYDFAAINDGTGVKNKYRKGSNLEATIDMLDHYNTLLFGSPKPLVISEYGGRAHIMENQPWSPERDGVMLRSANSMLMAFLERPNNILMTIPFIVIKAEWGRTSVPYNWRLMRQRFEADGETGNEWVYTELVRFYELWMDVAGTRVDSYATDPDILVDAYMDGADLYVIVNNLEFDETNFDLDLRGLGGANVLSIDIRHLHTVNDNPVLELSSVAELPDVVTLGGEATMIFRVELDAGVATTESSTETKHYASSMLQPIGASTTLSFDVDGVAPGTNGEAILRLGVGRAHGLSLTPAVSMNGTAVAVPSDYRGYDQYHNGNGRDSFFGVLEIPVPWSVVQANNQIDVTFPDNGGHVSSVALQIFNQSSTIVRRTN